MLYHIITYGCQMNVHESEKLAGMMEELGYKETDSVEKSDVVVFNTCCIRENAEQRAKGNIGALKKLKRNRPDMIIAVCGCMTQQKEAAFDLKTKFPFIDIIFGTHNLYKLKVFLKERLEKKNKIFEVLESDGYNLEEVPIYRTSRPNAWVNIVYGCNNFCTYCIVPYVRGRERSRKKNDILEEIKQLIAEGYSEITLLGQNVNSYYDAESKCDFAGLLREIDLFEGNYRIRFMTSHPKDLTEKIIKIISESKHIGHYIHLPVQSGSDKILKAMNRHYTSDDYLSKINLIRKYMPDCGITTDIMVGFPGETEEDFNDTLKLVEQCKFFSAFTFIYSVRKNTVAEKMQNQIEEDIKHKRLERLIDLQNEISVNISKSFIGRIVNVLGENFDSGWVSGRTDCGKLITFRGTENDIGEFIDVEITEAKLSSLIGIKIN